MGLIKAALGSVGGVLSEQWKEYFYCEALSADVLAVRGQKRISGRSSNANDNIISNGSVIAVADGQCMLIVEQGKIVDVCAEPGEYTYDMSTEPSIFVGNLGDNIKVLFQNIGKRFTFGGEPPKDQRVYYFNTKEIIGNKYGTPSPVPFRVVDERAAIDMDINISCFGEYSYKLVNPLLFYTNLCGNMADSFSRQEIESQLRSELLTALQPAFARISAQGIRYSALPAHTFEIAEALRTVLSAKWRDYRGIEIQNIGVSSVKADEDDEKRIKDLQLAASLTDPNRAGAYLAGATGAAMQAAAENEGGAAMAFMGMNMAQGAGGGAAANLFQIGQQQATPAPAANGWACSCGATGNTGNFCSACGKAKPAPAGSWVCECGTQNTGKFCPQCGKAKPVVKCAECGYEPEGAAPKFCPQCGKPFA